MTLLVSVYSATCGCGYKATPAPEQAGPALGVAPEDVSGGLGTSDCGTG